MHDIFGVDDRVVTRFTIRGTHRGDFRGIAPTGRQVAFGGIAVDVMRDGIRVDGWAQLDNLGLLAQLGAVEPPQPM